MKSKLKFLSNVVRRHPQFLKIAGRIVRKNISTLVDYNFMDGKSFPPKAVTFRISGICNLNCQMCIYRNSGFLDTTRMLPLDIFKKVIDEVYPSKPFIIFTGGEPLLHPNIVECLKYVKEKGLYCSLTTNGLSLTQHAKDITESGLDLLTVSIDGLEEIHDKIRGLAGTYRKAFEGIQEIKKFKKRPMLFINTSIQTDNYAHIDKMVDKAIEAGVDGMNIQVLWTRPPDKTTLHNRLFPEYQVRDGWDDKSLLQIDFKVLEDVIKRAKEKDFFVRVFPDFSTQQISTWYTDPAQLLNDRHLKCPWMMANVFHDGTIRMCDDIILGDLKEKGFWDIWNGEKMVKFRKRLKENKRFPICAGCCSMYRDYAI